MLKGAAAELCRHRELRNKYETNRSIKTWACYFLLKSKTTSGIIQKWTKQKGSLLAYLQMSENCFRARVAEMKALKLITLIGRNTIQLTSYEKAAEILDIPYTGLIKIEYDANTAPGNQIFQYFLRAQEIRENQQAQLDALHYYANKNPQLKEVLTQLMLHHGADKAKLHLAEYFQERLLILQMHYFKHGSDIWNVITTLRADINRSVTGIQSAHKYKAAQSVSYMKKRMAKLQLLTITKKQVQSECRTRLYISDTEGKKREAARYCRSSKTTFMQLCDQLTVKISTLDTTEKKQAGKRAA